MNIKNTLKASMLAIATTGTIFFAAMGSVSAASFSAGSSHSGSVEAGGVAWQCNAGTCKGAGSAASTDDDMKACQALVKATGPLGSFKSSNGTEWSPSKNPNRMAFCNSAVAQR